ncbi:hypothetical protein SDJN02_14912, partial [Cucurbita argyrosperma subsp. argyrosperma]
MENRMILEDMRSCTTEHAAKLNLHNHPCSSNRFLARSTVAFLVGSGRTPMNCKSKSPNREKQFKTDSIYSKSLVLSAKELKIHIQSMVKYNTLSDIRRSMAGIRETQSEGAIDFEAKIRVILILDKNTEALLTLLHHLLEPTAAINGRRFGIAANIRQARGKADELRLQKELAGEAADCRRQREPLEMVKNREREMVGMELLGVLGKEENGSKGVKREREEERPNDSLRLSRSYFVM